ncbi:MAG: DUF2075 domain-containing protein [Candidatus Auribacter fodinae]|jgi:general secretion pathway protein A|uniref:DUF2075 domain-containing protein n=1 Tax=Candidatus Auribacter fodinae TaxID=2093366 RepID=A0A3A4R281_9BACT|nr:MAG: DUF2075 domain-containing protein [Candidatus Auribacter fodinae]
MYKDFFGFSVSPFNTTPDASFFFASEQHQEALARLTYAIEERKGFVLITGEIGAGKTTLCHTLLSKLTTGVKTALVTNTKLTSKELLKEICHEFEIKFENSTRLELMHRLNDFLIDQLARDNNAVIIVDEAQNLTPSLLEEIRLISNLETDKEKLVQIILMGQPELSQKLELPRLKQLKQRIVTRFHLYPLSFSEAEQYIRHRLKIASVNERQIFTDSAIEEIITYSGGIPRLINIIADQALLHAYSSGKHKIDHNMLKEVIREFIPPHELKVKPLVKPSEPLHAGEIAETAPEEHEVAEKSIKRKKRRFWSLFFSGGNGKKSHDCMTHSEDEGVEIEFDDFIIQKINKFDRRFSRYLLSRPSKNRIIVRFDAFSKFKKELEKDGIFIELPE